MSTPKKIERKIHDRIESVMALRDDRSRGQVPGGGVVAGLTAGVVTLEDRFWYEIRAWAWGGASQSKESWCVREGYVDTWAELEEVLWQAGYADMEGNRYVISVVIIDACIRTAEVYDFCREHRGRIFPCKLRHQIPQPYHWVDLGLGPDYFVPSPAVLRLVNINAKYYKDSLYSRLRTVPGNPGAWYYHAELPRVTARQMASEDLNSKGNWQCVDKLTPNHLWSCGVLNLCAYDIMGIHYWDKRKPNPGGPCLYRQKTNSSPPEKISDSEKFKSFMVANGWSGEIVKLLANIFLKQEWLEKERMRASSPNTL